MAKTNEEIAADLLWRYVEQVRERGPEPPLSRAELQELLQALETAGSLGPALEEARAAAHDSALEAVVRRRMEAAPPPAPRALARPATAAGGRDRFPWKLRLGRALTMGATAALALALLTVNYWHRPEPAPLAAPAQRAALPHGVESLSEQRAHELIPRMVRRELAPAEERSLMWHMLVCPGCFDQYVALRSHGEIRSEAPPGRAVLVLAGTRR